MKNGIAIRGKELTEYIMRCGMIERSMPDNQMAIRALNPIAKAIGTPSSAMAIKPTTTSVLIQRPPVSLTEVLSRRCA
jgi:hypothetical protein